MLQLFVSSVYEILNNYFGDMIKMKDIKNCDAAASHSGSIRNYSDPESLGGVALFPGEENVIPAVLRHEAIPQTGRQAEQRRNLEDGCKNQVDVLKVKRKKRGRSVNSDY